MMILKHWSTFLEAKGWLSLHDPNCILPNDSMLAVEIYILRLQVTALQISFTPLQKESLVFLLFKQAAAGCYLSNVLSGEPQFFPGCVFF